jgi:glycine/D-amino acid oxidase-like deaminating enzyme
MRLGWIGLGVMGASMCAHLQRAGHALTVTTRTRAKAEALLAAGAAWADTPRAVAEASEVVFTMVGFPRDVREVALGKEADEVGRKLRAASRRRAKAHRVENRARWRTVPVGGRRVIGLAKLRHLRGLAGSPAIRSDGRPDP